MHLARILAGLALVTALALVAGPLSGDARAEGGDDKPYHVSEDGVVNWATFSGYRRYHSECHVCHGPDALGSSFAPSLVDSMKRMSYEDYLEVVVNGRQNVSTSSDKVMPAFGTNKNVMCFIDDIYAYLMARADGAIGRGRPDKEPKPQEAQEYVDACMG